MAKAKKTPAEKSPRSGKTTTPKISTDEKRTMGEINKVADKVLGSIKTLKKPEMAFPIRALSNVTFDTKAGFLRIKNKKKQRTLSVNTVKVFAQTLKLMALCKQLINESNFATKREAYYISKNWGDARFDEQTESDTVMDDVEALFSVTRENMRFYPEEKGGDVAGKLVVIDKEPGTGKEIRIDCTRFGSGAYSIPVGVEELRFETKAKFILAIETAGAFQRLVKGDFPAQNDCIMVSLGGVPTRSCRRFIRRLADEFNIPVYVFTDGDPYGYCNIYRTLKVGSGNAAHVNEFFCVPQAKFLGVTPYDIDEFDLPTHPLKDVDIKRAQDALKNDPFIQKEKRWQEALEKMIKMKVRVEQQAFAKHGLDYVTETYFPRKLANMKQFLP